ncbi:DUF1385 domain-containing protein [Evansella clarkii]|uniref:DUF1385 domain-containing protein n=1 Tax=Evansella clarkii TaxID=79879 RepID=UPI001115E546|nr:DUF1385 domain-containing protein [Evansella clarkii]
MKWEKCIRCGSNRVISRSPTGCLGIGFFLALPFFITANHIGEPTLLGNNDESNFLRGAIGILILAILVIYFGRQLYCKDCELRWKPSKNK